MREQHSEIDDSKDIDEVLLDLIQKRDEAALALFYERKSRLIYSLILNIVHTVPDAEEVTQEVFYTLWKKAGTFDSSRGSVMGWLTTIARRLAIDRTRSKQYKAQGRERSVDTGVHGRGWEEKFTDFSNKIAVNTQAREVLDALRTLGDQYREVITLSYYEGLPHSSISERLDIPLGTVKSRLREGVVQLRRLLNIKVASKDGSQGNI